MILTLTLLLVGAAVAAPTAAPAALQENDIAAATEATPADETATPVDTLQRDS